MLLSLWQTKRRVYGWRSVCLVFVMLSVCALEVLGPSHGYSMTVDDVPALMKQGRYSEVASFLKLYLQKKPDDYRAWNLLGVAYYHAGQPEQALKILKNFETQTEDPAQSYFYQGMSFMLLKKNALAAEYLKRAALANHSKIHARMAAFELVLWYYNRRKPIRTRRWVKFFLARYSSSKNAGVVRRIRDNLKQGLMRGEFHGIHKPDLKDAFYFHAPLSLWNGPNYWFVDIGGAFLREDGKKVQEIGKLLSRQDVLYRMLVNMGIGVGPYEHEGFSYNGGYVYRQQWNTDLDRITVFSEDPLDVAYFPFQTDLLVQQHKLLQHFSYVYEGFSAGTSLFVEHQRIGSEWIGGPEPWSIAESFTISNGFSITPWLGYQISIRHLIQAYTHLQLELREDSEDFSYQSFSQDYLPLSFGVIYDGDFPRADLNVKLEVYKYGFIFNDPYLDYEEIGGLGRVSYSPFPGLRFYTEGRYAEKAYAEELVRAGDCNLLSKSPGKKAYEAAAAKGTKLCSRDDSVIRGYLGVDVTYRESTGVFVQVGYVDNVVSPFDFLSFGQIEVIAGVMLAFPSPDRVREYTSVMSDKPTLSSVRQ